MMGLGLGLATAPPGALFQGVGIRHGGPDHHSETFRASRAFAVISHVKCRKVFPCL